MPIFPVLSQLILVITVGVLFFVAFTDLKHYRIPNELVIVLAGLYFLHALVSGRWIQMHWNVGFALIMFALMLFAYTRKMMGGGDLKILTVAFLWVGLDCALWFALLMAAFGGLHTALAKFGWVDFQEEAGLRRIPLGPTIAAALIGTLLLCVEPGLTFR